MPPTPPTAEMARLHEEYLAQINDGTKTKASGSGWDEQADGRNHHDRPFAYRWDGKATKGKSVTITLEMIEKILDQAHGERPQIGLRWYGDERLKSVLADWVAVRGADWEETLMAARAWAELTADTGWETVADLRQLIENARAAVEREKSGDKDATIARLREDLEAAHADLAGTRQDLASALLDLQEIRNAVDEQRETVSRLEEAAQRAVSNFQAMEAELERYRSQASAAGQGRYIPPVVPRLPWTVIWKTRLEGREKISGMHYGPDGAMTQVAVTGPVRVERTGSNRPRLIVNETIVRHGDLYVDGKIQVRAWEDKPEAEVG